MRTEPRIVPSDSWEPGLWGQEGCYGLCVPTKIGRKGVQRRISTKERLKTKLHLAGWLRLQSQHPRGSGRPVSCSATEWAIKQETLKSKQTSKQATSPKTLRMSKIFIAPNSEQAVVTSPRQGPIPFHHGWRRPCIFFEELQVVTGCCGKRRNTLQ